MADLLQRLIPEYASSVATKGFDTIFEKLTERTRPEHLSTFDRILYQEFGSKPLLPSEGRKLKALVNEVFDWGWSSNDLINRILEDVGNPERKSQ